MLVPSGWKVKKHKRNANVIREDTSPKIYILMPYFALPAFMQEIVKMYSYSKTLKKSFNGLKHGLRTPNEGIKQRYLKNWADAADKICFGRT